MDIDSPQFLITDFYHARSSQREGNAEDAKEIKETEESIAELLQFPYKNDLYELYDRYKCKDEFKLREIQERLEELDVSGNPKAQLLLWTVEAVLEDREDDFLYAMNDMSIE